jgi:hypothetical protein
MSVTVFPVGTEYYLTTLQASIYYLFNSIIFYTARPNLFVCFWLDIMKRTSTLSGVCFGFWLHSTICCTGVLANKIQTGIYCVHHVCMLEWNGSRSAEGFVLNWILHSFNNIVYWWTATLLRWGKDNGDLKKNCSVHFCKRLKASSLNIYRDKNNWNRNSR